MSSLFDKIATLVNAQVNELLGKNPTSPLARIRLNADDAEKNPRDSAGALRRRLDEAVEFEDVLQDKIDALMREAADLDAQIDVSVRQGDEFGARRLQGQLNIKQQQLTIAESELRDHRALTRHLMQEMRNLEAALDERDRVARSRPADRQPPRSTRIPVDGADLRARVGDQSIVDTVSDKMNEARDGLENLLNRRPPQAEPPRAAARSDKFIVVDEEPDPRQPKRQKKDAGDMNRRLSRLSRPPDDDQ